MLGAGRRERVTTQSCQTLRWDFVLLEAPSNCDFTRRPVNLRRQVFVTVGIRLQSGLNCVATSWNYFAVNCRPITGPRGCRFPAGMTAQQGKGIERQSRMGMVCIRCACVHTPAYLRFVFVSIYAAPSVMACVMSRVECGSKRAVSCFPR
jgi:hypothetical protein